MKKLHRFARLTFAVVSVFVSASTLAGQVGTTTGTFQVSAGGEATYAMGIEVPPGIMGVAPQISINYSSGAGNGLLGLGANISGLSSLTRCGRNIVQDGLTKPVQFDNTDYFCLNGQRLILTSTGKQYGEDGSTYQTEIESFQKVTARGSVAGGPAYFEVLAKGGSKLIFGNSLVDNAQLERSIDPITGVVSSWGISYLEDKHGNRVIYHYLDESRSIDGTSYRQIVPHKVTYGHNTSLSNDAETELSVEFVYESRPDEFRGFDRGQGVIQDLRIGAIETYVEDELVKEYQIYYETAPVGQQSRITQIRECAVQNNCLLPVSFTWHDYSVDWNQANQSIPTALLSSDGRLRGTAVDVNADGHTDWVTALRDASGDELIVLENNNNTWTPSSTFQVPAPIFDYQRHPDGVTTSELVDLNGDGLVDWVVAFVDENSQPVREVYLNSGTNWVYSSQASNALPLLLADLSESSNPKLLAEFVDLNGDALPDMVSSYIDDSGTPFAETYLNTGDGWVIDDDYALPSVSIDYSLYSKGAATGFLLDLNNDGLIDFTSSYKRTAGAPPVLASWLNTGAGWVPSPELALPTYLSDYSAATPQGNASPVDINGDGLIDIVQAHEYLDGTSSSKAWLNTGNGWREDAGLAPPQIIWKQFGTLVQSKGAFSDVNNDGLPDLVVSYSGSGTQNTVYRNTGYDWDEDPDLAMPIILNHVSSGNDSIAKALLIDANSDGRADLVSSSGGNSSTVFLAAGANDNRFALPDLVSEFTDGLGNSHKPSYTPATHGNTYQAYSDAQYPIMDVTGPMLLVSEVETAVGVTQTSKAEHRYFGKKLHLTGRGDLGFAKKVAIDKRTDLRIETEFSQTWPFIGSATSMQKLTSQGSKLIDSVNTYELQSVFGGKTMVVYQPQKETSTFDLRSGDQIDSTKTEILEIDDFGNITRAKTTRIFYADTGSETYTTTKETDFNNNIADWLIGQVQSAKETVQAPGQSAETAHVTYTYYSNGRTRQKVVQPLSDKSLTEEYEYDAFGNLVKTTISANAIEDRINTATFTPDGRFENSATNALGHTAYTEHHPHFGTVVRTQDPNGAVERKLYDKHGRMIKTTKIRTTEDAAAAADQSHSVIVFTTCESNVSCPENAAYFMGVVDNEGEAPETVYYDNRNREVRKQTQGFDGTSVFVDTHYDEYGRKQKISNPYFVGETPQWTRYEYDVLSRLVKVTSPGGITLRTEHYKDHSSVINHLDQKRVTYVNGQGNPVKVLDNLSQPLSYTYDSGGRLISTIANGQAETEIVLTYDEFGRKIRESDPDLGVWEYQYDALGNLIWQKDANGQIVSMKYDKLNRITERVEAEGTTYWEYDTGEFGKGKLYRVWNDQGYSRTHAYDKYGRQTEVITVVDGEPTSIKTDYHHTTDRVQFVEYPSGLKIRKEFNSYGFPLSIRSSITDYLERYEDAEADAIALANDANAYRDSTSGQRAAHVDTYDAEKAAIEALEVENNADERRYRRELPGYNGHVNRQKEAIEQAKHFERWGNSFRASALVEQRKALIYAYSAEYAVAKAEKKHKSWSDFTELNNTDLWPNGGGLAELKRHLSNVLVISESQLESAYLYVKPEDLAHTAQWLAGHAENYGKNAQRQMDGASARYARVKEYVEEAELHANRANTFYRTRMKPISDRMENRAGIIATHYANLKDAADAITTIDDTLKAKYDAAINAQRQAQALLNYYESEGSALHWLAESADAEGKVTKFTQGKHVTTDVQYEQYTGRLARVDATSQPQAIELDGGQSVPQTTNKLNEFLESVTALSVEAQANASSSLTQLTETQRLIAALNPDDPLLSPAMQNATLAQLEALRVNESIFNVDLQLNTQLSELSTESLAKANLIQQEFAGLSDRLDMSEQAQINNVLVYNARVHQLVADHNTRAESLYREASNQQTVQAANIANVGEINPDHLQEYASLGTYHQQISTYHQARADAIQLDPGAEEGSPELVGLAKASYRQKKLLDRHADISNKRRRLNVALFAPLQHLNNATSEKYAQLQQSVISEHFSSNKALGTDDRQRFRELERLYRMRLSVLEQTLSEDEDIFADDGQRKALYQHLANVNAQLGIMYTDMGSQDYWNGMFDEFVQSLTDKSSVYRKLADNHDQISANHALLATKSSELYDHSILGSDNIVLEHSYTWDAIGNLVERNHGVADLRESFAYDELNRLVQSSINGSSVKIYELAGRDQVTYDYDALGNIIFKSDVGRYTYNSSRPHAVASIDDNNVQGLKNANYLYDDNGNLTSGDGRAIDYTSFNKPSQIAAGGTYNQFTYGPERQLIKQIVRNGADTKTTIYVGNQYEKTTEGTIVTEKYHLSTHNGGVIAVIIDKSNEQSSKTHYLHRDHLDSIVAITNEQGYVVERFFYDAFGKQLTAVNPNGNNLYANYVDNGLTDRGFTAHKTLDSGLIHMGGRVYDPEIGRFTSADPHIQFAGNLQNYNRYSYVNNNPLAFNDPSGYFLSSIFKALKKLFKFVAKIVKKVANVIKKVVKFIKENWRVIVAVVVAVVVPYAVAAVANGVALGAATTGMVTSMSFGYTVAAGAIAGGLSSLVLTGSLTAALKGALVGGISAGIFAYSPYKGSSSIQKIKHAAVRTGLASGTASKINGGSFSKGFLSGLKSGAIGSVIQQVGQGVADWWSDKGEVYEVKYNSTTRTYSHTLHQGPLPEDSKLYVNGILGYDGGHSTPLSRVFDLGRGHTQSNSFFIFNNQSNGIISDLTESLLGKVTGTSSLARHLGNLLASSNGTVSVFAHSQGTIIMTNALNSAALSNGKAGHLIGQFNGAAVLKSSVESAMADSGARWGPFNGGWDANPADFVNQVVGLNGIKKPLNMLRSLLALPKLFSNTPGVSPHTFPTYCNTPPCVP